MTDKQVSKAAQAICKFKEKYHGALLFFRFGDFYEAFFDDAERCSKICGLDLIERDVVGELVPLVEIPFWLIERYVKKITAAGCTVGLCESLASGNTKREVVRTFSPQDTSKMPQTKVYKRPSSPSPSARPSEGLAKDGRDSHHRPQLRLVRPAGE